MNTNIIDYNVDTFEYIIGIGAYLVPEIKAVLDSHNKNPQPYAAYIYCMGNSNSPFKNIPEDDKPETVIFDIINSVGVFDDDFDPEDKMIKDAVEKYIFLTATATSLFADELEQEVHRWRKYMKDNPLSDDNFMNREKIVDKATKIIRTLAEVRKAADDENGPDTRGGHEVGDY